LVAYYWGVKTALPKAVFDEEPVEEELEVAHAHGVSV
jgi:hypothetical protein